MSFGDFDTLVVVPLKLIHAFSWHKTSKRLDSAHVQTVQSAVYTKRVTQQGYQDHMAFKAISQRPLAVLPPCLHGFQMATATVLPAIGPALGPGEGEGLRRGSMSGYVNAFLHID